MNETAAIARNFHEEKMNILRPRIDWRGDGPGYIEEAFQAYSFAVAGLYEITGVSTTTGRSFSLVIYLAAGIYVYLLGVRIYGPRAGRFSLLFYSLAPLGIYYGRGFLPEPLLLLCTVGVLYHFVVWSETGLNTPLVVSAVWLALAVLTKPFYLYLGLPLAYLAVRRMGWTFLRDSRMWLVAGCAMIPAALWYTYAHTLWLDYGNTARFYGQGFPKLATPEILTDLSFYRTMARRVVRKMTTATGVPLLGLGFLLLPRTENRVLYWWAGGLLIIVVATAGAHYPHDHYLLPALPLLTCFMGKGAAYLWNRRLFLDTMLEDPLATRLSVAGLCVLLGFSSLRALDRYYGMPPDLPERLQLVAAVRENTPPDSRLVVEAPPLTSPGDLQRHRERDGTYMGSEPVILYQTHRKGWALRHDSLSLHMLETLRGKGADYFVTPFRDLLRDDSTLYRQLRQKYTEVATGNGWTLIKLTSTFGEEDSPGAPSRISNSDSSSSPD